MAGKSSKTNDAEFTLAGKEAVTSSSSSSSFSSSPTRRANLFADYHATSSSNNQPVSAFPPPGGVPQSPSLPEFKALRAHVRTNSDVQGLVKRFEHLDVRDRDAESVERRRKHDAELRRAQIAREEAESDVRRLREDLRRSKRDVEESRERERRVAKRLEVVMEEFASAKDQHASQSAVYEKELRKARKEAYKSSSTVIKLQEELKSTRNSLRITQSGLEMEKHNVQRKEQDVFDAQYQLAALREEVDKLRANLQIVEEERDALKSRLQEDEVAQVAAAGLIALPDSQEEDANLQNTPAKRSPRKRLPSPLSDDKENVGVTPRRSAETTRLREELMREQMRREHAEEMLEFLSLECKFRCCSCMNASNDGSRLSLPLTGEAAAALVQLTATMKNALTFPGDFDDKDCMQIDSRAMSEEAARKNCKSDTADWSKPRAGQSNPEIQDGRANLNAEENDTSRIVHRPDSAGSQATCVAPSPVIEAVSVNEGEAGGEINTHNSPSPLEPTAPQTPIAIENDQTTTSRFHQPSIRTITTTTTVPMHFTPVAKPVSVHVDYPEGIENVPPSSAIISDSVPFDRAAALAAIEYRRGRAKSFAAGHMTPRKQMLEGTGVMKERRDISAPALGGKTTSGVGGPVKAPGSIGRAAGRRLM
ncbi:hypothetical protein M433DRAFT_5998 [Acidomyces richmondensis BFW]|nr:MAG: hypothetical protein FE78DRAFT_33940 [Acidomyces sp. 'richmondensis']KYG43812.1 hypothetical protein M433DRAFT_5998 [Acidomyces richmondensis BFW]